MRSFGSIIRRWGRMNPLERAAPLGRTAVRPYPTEKQKPVLPIVRRNRFHRLLQDSNPHQQNVSMHTAEHLVYLCGNPGFMTGSFAIKRNSNVTVGTFDTILPNGSRT